MDSKLKRTLTSLLTFILGLSALLNPMVLKAAESDALWARSTVTGSANSYFNRVASDVSNNNYAVGVINGTSTFNFGNGVTVAGAYAGGSNLLIVKYNSEGVAQWAKSTVTAPDTSIFNNIYTDSSGNSFGVGYITGLGTFNFGDGVTAAGANAGQNTLIVKYNSDGVAQWAVTTSTAPGGSFFNDVSLDSLGNIYAAGYIGSTGTFNFGNGVTVAGANVASNTLIIKYNSNGVAQWAKSNVTAPAASAFNGIFTDPDGNSYAVGNIIGTGSYDFGSGVTISGAGTGNILIIKYNASGIPQWAKSTLTAPGSSVLTGISVDSLGNSYAVGYLSGTSQYDFGGGVTISGAYSTTNAFIIKYGSSGSALWANSTIAAPGDSYLGDIRIDASGNSYSAGYIYGSGTFNFGGGVILTMGNATTNPLLIKYDSNGTAQWAKSTISGSDLDYSAFYGVSIDSSGNIYGVGEIDGILTYNFGGGITATGVFSSVNPVIVKYSGPPVAAAASEASSDSSPSTEIQIPQMSENVSYPIVASPIKDSNPQGQQVFTIVQPQTFGFDAYLFSKAILPSSLVLNSPGKTNTILGGGVNGILGVKSSFGTYWQVGKLQEMWYKTYPPEGHESAIIIPELQEKPSIIAFRYTDSDLIPIGRPEGRYNPKNFRLAHSLDGKVWKIMTSSIVDTVNQTVAVVDTLGGYYMIVAR